jgi:TRAP-type C4-dicarboxylate transport system permease small subunit
MRKISLCVIAAFLILTGVGGWIASTTQARVEAPTPAETIDPLQVMMNARDLPSEEFEDYTFVFTRSSR